MNKTIPIIFAVNNSYVKQLATVIVSILLNTGKDTCIQFSILTKDITVENQNKLSELIKFNSNVTFNFINMKSYTESFNLEEYLSKRLDYNYITIETYYRFFIPEIFPDYNKVIYLDSDLILNDDIQKLFNEDIQSYYAGVVHDVFFENLLRSRKMIGQNIQIEEYYLKKLKCTDYNYFNAGVLLMNLEKIRKDNVVKKLWDFVIHESPLCYQDQDALNSVLNKNVKYLPYEWNVLKEQNHYKKNKNKALRKTLNKVYNNSSIFHFVGNDKPWCVVEGKQYNYNNIDKWWEYYKLTPFFEQRDLEVLENIKYHKKYSNRFNFVSIEIYNFKFLSVYIEQHRFHICILGFIKFRFKLKSISYKKSIV